MKGLNYCYDDSALSPVVGEMMMIVLALLLVSLFSVALFNLIPSERSETVDIMMNNSQSDATLWHKGGDWIKKSDLQAIIIKNKKITTIRSSDDAFILEGNSFDLGDRITVRPDGIEFEKGDIVRLVSGDSIIFSGVAT